MKEKVSLRDSTMKMKSHWLEIEHDGDYYLALRSAKGVLGGERTKASRVVLDSMTHFAPGVIIKVGPLRFYRTEDDVRISFTEDETEEGLSGYDRISHEDLVTAIEAVIGKEAHESPRKKKTAAPKPKRAVKVARHKRAK